MPEIKQNSSKKKYDSSHTFSTLSQTHSEPTKKSIEVEEIIPEHAHITIDNQKYIFSLPISVHVSSVMSLVTSRFSDILIHAQDDHYGGRVILHPINAVQHRPLHRLLDCMLVCCRVSGSGCGPLSDTFKVITISIKRQVIENNCTVIVSNPFRTISEIDTFNQQIIIPMQQELQKLNTMSYSFGEQTVRVIEADEPEQIDLAIRKKVFALFLERKGKHESVDSGTFHQKTYESSWDKLNAYIGAYFHPAQNEKPGSKPMKLLEAILEESSNIFESLWVSHQQSQQNHELSILQSFFLNNASKQFTIYAIESLFAISFQDQVLKAYQSSCEDQCKLFNEQCGQLNAQLNNAECFKHLELRDRYQLLNQKRPYNSAIDVLKTLEFCTSFREMLLVVQKTFSYVKIDCLASHGGKVELSSMDDLLPVMIFVSMRANVPNFPAYVKMVDDYIRIKDIFELEERVITTLFVAVEDITRKWAILDNNQ